MNLLLSHPLHGSFSLRQQYDLKALAATLGASVQLVLHHLNQQERLEQAMLDKEMWRRQLSTELHNGPVQNMTLLVKKLNRQLDTDSLHQVQDMAKEITSELRSLCSRLQPFSSNTMPAWIIREQVRSFQEENPGIAVSLTIDTEPAPRPPDVVCLALRFILEESLANIAKHAQADMVQVKATHDLQKLELEVTDNGSGADHLYQTPHDHSNGQGLMDMKYWASLAKGAFSVISLTGERGVKVSVLFKAENYIYLPELQLLPAADATNKYAYSST